MHLPYSCAFVTESYCEYGFVTESAADTFNLAKGDQVCPIVQCFKASYTKQWPCMVEADNDEYVFYTVCDDSFSIAHGGWK